MHTWIRRALCALGLTGGVLVLGFLMAETASAAGNHTSGQDGAVSGNQTGVQVTAPVNATGNQVTVLGHDNTATSTSDDATAAPSTGGDDTTTGQDGIGSGNQTEAPVQTPVNATGNQVTVLGHDNTATSTGDDATAAPSTGGDNTTTGQDGTGSGNQTEAPVQAPVNLTGNQVTVVGEDNTTDTSGGTSVVSPPTTGSPGTSGDTNGGTGQVSPPTRTGPMGNQAGPAVSAARAAPVAAVLPNTGAPTHAAGLAALALALLAGGLLLLRRGTPAW